MQVPTSAVGGPLVLWVVTRSCRGQCGLHRLHLTLLFRHCMVVARWAVPGGPAGGGPQYLVGHVSLDSIWLSVQCHIKSTFLLPSENLG